MPRIECPQCQTVRVVMEGKVKRCQKCDTKLTTLPVVAKQPAPDDDGQVAEIQAQLDAALDQILNLQDMQTKSLDELTAEQLCETFQILADALVQRPEQLTAKGQKDSKVSLAIRIAEDRLRLEAILIELRRRLWLGRVDVDVIE